MDNQTPKQTAVEIALAYMHSRNSSKYRSECTESNFRAIRLGMDNPLIVAYLVALHEDNVSEIDLSECKKELANIVNMAAEHYADSFVEEV